MLIRASEVHNLPVMSHAIALGAERNWKCSACKDRTALHHAVISVGFLKLSTEKVSQNLKRQSFKIVLVLQTFFKLAFKYELIA